DTNDEPTDPTAQPPTDDPTTPTPSDTPSEPSEDPATDTTSEDPTEDTTSDEPSDTPSDDPTSSLSSPSSSSSSSEISESKTNASDTDGTHEKSGLSTGAIAGVIIASVLGLILLTALYFFWRRRQRSKRFYNPNDFEAFPDFDPSSNTNLNNRESAPAGYYEKSVQSREPFQPPMFGHGESVAYSDSEMSGFHSPTAPDSRRFYMGTGVEQPGYSSYTYGHT
ncbi:hypothetical protein IWW50_002932, partial [Coemansia erecta]